MPFKYRITTFVFERVVSIEFLLFLLSIPTNDVKT